MKVYAIYVLINFAVVAGVNIAFVYVTLNESGSILTLAQILLAFFKAIFNSVCSPFLIRWASSSILSDSDNTNNINANTENDPHQRRHRRKAMHSSAKFVSVQLFVSLFNNIAIPCLVVACISPNCFINVFQEAPTVSSTFYYTGDCTVGTSAAGCASFDLYQENTVYHPPFTYSYQCSSSIITYYAPTFVNLCIVTSLVTPLFQICTQLLHRRAVLGTRWFQLLDALLPLILKPIEVASSSVPTLTDAEGEGETAPHVSYFDANQLLISILTNLGILLTFGVVFPPLAATFAITILCVTAFARLKVGRFLSDAMAQNSAAHLQNIDSECKGVGSEQLLRKSINMMVLFCFFFYTLFLFDTLGDSVGYAYAYFVFILVPLMPVAFLLMSIVYARLSAVFNCVVVRRNKHNPTDPVGIEVDAAAADVEMAPYTPESQPNVLSVKESTGHQSVDEITYNVLQI